MQSLVLSLLLVTCLWVYFDGTDDTHSHQRVTLLPLKCACSCIPACVQLEQLHQLVS